MAVRGRPAGLLGRLRPRRETLWGYAFISPWLVGFVGLYLIPLQILDDGLRRSPVVASEQRAAIGNLSLDESSSQQ